MGACDIYVQHHNDLGVATANAMADVEGGANWIDASVLGIGDRGGCVALEEAAEQAGKVRVAVHDASRLEWSLSLPLPSTGSASRSTGTVKLR